MCVVGDEDLIKSSTGKGAVLYVQAWLCSVCLCSCVEERAEVCAVRDAAGIRGAGQSKLMP